MTTTPTETPTAALTAVEEQAIAIGAAVYEAVRRAAALDAPDHWERFANRLRSAAYAATAPRFLEQVARRYGVAHTGGDALEALLAADTRRQREILRVLRQESNAVSVLVRARRARRES